MKLVLWSALFSLLVTTGWASSHHSKPQKSRHDYYSLSNRRSGEHSHRQRHSEIEQQNELQREQLESQWYIAEPEQRKKVWLNFTEANKQITYLIRHRYKNETAMLKKPKKQDRKKKKQKDCHSIAMLQCGCDSLRAFEGTLKNKSFVNVETRCEIRKKFFECLANASKLECKRPNVNMLTPKKEYHKQKKEIVRVLWTTRECLLGPVDQRREKTMSATELNINSRFCDKMMQQKHGRHKKGAKNNFKKSKNERHPK